MKTRRIRDFLAGMLVTALAAALVLPAGAELVSKTIEVFTGAEIYVDGVKMEPTDANGNPVETFIYNGTTYVPLRAVSQSLGYAVNWDGTTQSVYIGEQPGAKQYLNTVCPPYQTDRYSTPTTITMAGQKYANCIAWSSGYGYALYNLNGKYNTLEFDVGHVDGKSMSDSTLNIYLDGELSFSLDLTSEMLPTHISVPLYGALQMKIEMGSGGGCYGLGNVEIY